MITRIPDYFHTFRCLAGDCPDTCCGPWDIVVDDEAKERYLSMEGPLGDRIRSAMTVTDGECCISSKDGRCALLTKDGLCPIIAEVGEEALCVTCHSHPRFTEIYGGLQETTLCISCPEAARLLLERTEPLRFITEIDTVLPEPDDLDADEFDLLLGARQTAIGLVQDRRRPLTDRLCLLLCFANRLQDHLTSDLPFCELLCRRYEDPDYLDKQLIRIRRKRRYGSMIRIRQLMYATEHLTDTFPTLLRELERVDLHRNEIALEQLTVYFIFRWWLKAACDDQLWQQVAAAVVSVLTIAGLSKYTGDILAAARLYSKEIEHSDANLALIRKAMNLPMFSRNELLKLLEVPHAI